MVAFTAMRAVLIAGCTPAEVAPKLPALPSDAEGASYVITNLRTLAGETLSLAVSDGRFVESPNESWPRFDGRELIVTAGFVDSHVHLALRPTYRELSEAGVVAAVDMASPINQLGKTSEHIRMARAGPMLTTPRGYPTRSWGRGGYGLECATPLCGTQAVDKLAKRGAKLIKIPLDHGGVDGELLAAIVTRAHQHKLPVVAHALTRDSVRVAADSGVDVLAHTPVEPIPEELAREFRGRHVVSTLAAFGGAPSAVENLRRFRTAGATVIYGTDLGNTHEAAIQKREIALMAKAGMDARAIVYSATTAANRLWGFDDLGLAPGKSATFLLYEGQGPGTTAWLARPRAVYSQGHRLR